ncbi:MAG TPA: succinyldiaminopimelate transaminase [Steroidobacteraceae bacterium]|jgi:N-succinyldiaminopimelate aminotransferase|nr:succinyldiaminopimelate transaminase [Steroidobacteraceae bacterium]
MMNPLLTRLHAYPFERLARLLSGARPPAALTPIKMSVGEPQHEPPANVLATLRENLHRLGTYPTVAGVPELRSACASWLERRFHLPRASVDPATMVLPVNGTREALFSFVQAAVDGRSDQLVLMPNPFYQIYEGAALLAGAGAHFLATTPANDNTPGLDAVPQSIWGRCQVLFLCSPGNPSGKVLSLEYLRHALALAERHDFIIAADECYTEIYLDERSPPPGLLQACLAAGHDRFQRCVVFHSLSKRSSVPGLRSGFVCGDPEIIARYLLYRTYHGSAMAVPTQLASVTAWQDEEYAARNRRLYQEKFERVLPILGPCLGVGRPDGAFYLWPDVRGDDERFVRDLYATQAITVLPGSYLARAGADANPGAGRVRISLVPPLAQCIEAAERIREFVQRNPT